MERTTEPSCNGHDSLSGRRVLVVEDEAIIAMELQAVFEAAGAVVVGPAHTVKAALACASAADISAAVLDLRLGLEPVGPVAELLAHRGVPFLFYSGQPVNDPLRQVWPRVAFLAKPALARQLTAAVVRLLETEPRIDSRREMQTRKAERG
jgi:DNA-binding NtrC family response regulator